MRALFAGLLLLLASGCVQKPMTIQQWRAEQARKARMEQIRKEGRDMSQTSVTFTKEEQEQASTEQKSMPTQQK